MMGMLWNYLGLNNLLSRAKLFQVVLKFSVIVLVVSGCESPVLFSEVFFYSEHLLGSSMN